MAKHIHIHVGKKKVSDIGLKESSSPEVKRNLSAVKLNANMIKGRAAQIIALLEKDKIDFSKIADLFDKLGEEAKAGFRLSSSIDHS